MKPDYPPWLQEIVLRCLEIEPVWRHPTASQLAFDLAHPDQVKLTARSERLKRDPLSTVWRRRFNGGITQQRPKSDVAVQLASGPIVAVALDTEEGSGPLNECLRMTAAHLLATLPNARLACINVLKLGRISHRPHARRSRATTSTSIVWSRSVIGPRRSNSTRAG